jgi:glucose-6-phosphate 1-dehydrogenase
MSRERFRELDAESSGSGHLAARSGDWIRLDYELGDGYRALRAAVNGDGRPVVYYLATPPNTFAAILLNRQMEELSCGSAAGASGASRRCW